MVYPYVSKEKQQEEVLTDILQDADEKQKTEEVTAASQRSTGTDCQLSSFGSKYSSDRFSLPPCCVSPAFPRKGSGSVEKNTEEKKQGACTFLSVICQQIYVACRCRHDGSFLFFQTMEKEEKNPYLAMELKLFCRDMKNEMLEPALDKFGKRCGSALYLKFCALLIQNVKKGTKDFLPMLREEAASAFLLQKQQVKKAGEEAGDEAFVSHGTAFTACYAAYHDSGIFIVFSFLTFSDICMVVCIRKCLKYRSCYVSARVRKCEAYNLFKSGKGVRRCR